MKRNFFKRKYWGLFYFISSGFLADLERKCLTSYDLAAHIKCLFLPGSSFERDEQKTVRFLHQRLTVYKRSRSGYCSVTLRFIVFHYIFLFYMFRVLLLKMSFFSCQGIPKIQKKMKQVFRGTFRMLSNGVGPLANKREEIMLYEMKFIRFIRAIFLRELIRNQYN